MLGSGMYTNAERKPAKGHPGDSPVLHEAFACVNGRPERGSEAGPRVGSKPGEIRNVAAMAIRFAFFESWDIARAPRRRQFGKGRQCMRLMSGASIGTSLEIITRPEMVNTLPWTDTGHRDELPHSLNRLSTDDQDEIRQDGDCPFCGEPLDTVEIHPMVGGGLIRERCMECGTTVEQYWMGTR